ncbi:hypothetical protein [Methylobacterium sp. NEAU K]|uniref:hypothetical protein n=1 Tax=Methylobacterium sp. NEAU K TaxID=3064946 RepID=UPI002735227B|nr:hypothetical protein [Methylobacterium sp. NEAU K]MDP4006057.1 hypothetical protein [Methylobacterium sp. NEAU K]
MPQAVAARLRRQAARLEHHTERKHRATTGPWFLAGKRAYGINRHPATRSSFQKADIPKSPELGCYRSNAECQLSNMRELEADAFSEPFTKLAITGAFSLGVRRRSGNLVRRSQPSIARDLSAFESPTAFSEQLSMLAP